MKPSQQPRGSLIGNGNEPTNRGSNRDQTNRRRRDLTLPIPQREAQLAVPLPLPPNSAPSTSHNHFSNSFGPTTILRHQPTILFSELERLNRIGSGAGGTVYKVLHRPTGRFFALKVISGYHEEMVRHQIRREIQILRDVDHPNVVKCHEMFDHNGDIHMLLELLEGGSLEGTHIPDETRLAEIAHQILCGLAYLQKRHIAHRDIKPSNLLINARKQVKIADFGVSKILAQTMDQCNSSVGTIAYMSPERINTDLSDGRYDGYAGDIWSFGVSILEFYVGRYPFGVGRLGDWASLMCAICMSEPPQAPVTASRELRDFIGRCLQRESRRRWTAMQLLGHPFITQLTGSKHPVHQNLGQRQLLPPPPPPPLSS